MKKVITYGTFDLFHEGHYNLLKRAKALGDYLIVGVTTEDYDQTRGKLNVVDSIMTRIDNVKKSGFADEVIIEAMPGQKLRDIKKYGIDVFTVGSDWVGVFDYLKSYCEVVYLDRTKDISSTMLREKSQSILRMGIIGTGRIANRFLPEAKLVSGVNTQAVYNPRKESADKFAEKWELDGYSDLEAFFETIDAVYIASPHETHYDYIMKALEYKKHVLCEKPMVLSEKEAAEVFKKAKEQKCIVFEGIKTAYCPGFNNLIGLACSGAIGEIKNIEATFTKLENKKSRELNDAEFGGSFTELGNYTILPALKIFGDEPIRTEFLSVKNENGIDTFTKCIMVYKEGIATATCGLGVKSEGQLLICGTDGYIKVDAPWWKTSYFEVHHEDPNDIEKYSDRYLGDGLRYEISDFLSMINGNDKGGFKLTSEDSLFMARMMEKFLNERKQKQ